MTDLAFASAAELGAIIRNREISPVEVVPRDVRAHRADPAHAQ